MTAIKLILARLSSFAAATFDSRQSLSSCDSVKWRAMAEDRVCARPVSCVFRDRKERNVTRSLEGRVAVITPVSTSLLVLAKATMLVMLMGLPAACSSTAPSPAQQQKEQTFEEGCQSSDPDLVTYCGH